MSEPAAQGRSRAARFLDAVERFGDRLPEPVFIFLWLILALVIASVVCAAAGVSAVNPVTHETLVAKSLLSAENLRTLFTDMSKTFAAFPPLGLVLTVMLGAGVAERTGLFATAIRAGMRQAPRTLLAPAVLLAGLLSNHAADSGLIVLPPLAAVVFAAVGRHPIAGIACAYAGCIAAFAGNPIPGQFDALILGLTEPAARLLDPHWTANMAGNWFVSLTGCALFVGAGWWINDRIVEPRLGPWQGQQPAAEADAPLTPAERKGLVWAGLAALGVTLAWAAMALAPGGPLRDATQVGPAQWTPFFRSLAAGFFLLFLLSGAAFGVATGAIRKDSDLVAMASEALAGMAGYLVMVFAAAHFIAMFTWSGLGAIVAIKGAAALDASGLPIVAFLLAIVLLTGGLDLVIASASAKWAALGPVLVPMLMLLGVSPEITTAAYRMGDSTINIASPMNAYFVLSLTFARRWVPGFTVGGLISALLPYALAFLGVGLVVTALFAGLQLPPGPGAGFHYILPHPR